MELTKLHAWNLTPKEARALQSELARQLIFQPLTQCTLVAGADISYSRGDDQLFAAIVVLDIKKMAVIEVASHRQKATFPYVSGLLAFREIPPLLTAFEKLKNLPDVVLCDGQGIAHPRGLGLAAHFGLWLNLPTVGCAKSRLVGEHDPLDFHQWAQTPLRFKEKCIGRVVRSKKRVNPLFVSPGHLIDLEGSVDVVRKCVTRYRVPEPIRQAHLIVNNLRMRRT